MLGRTPPPPAAGATWWKPDGSPTAAPATVGQDYISVGDQPGRRGMRFVFVTRGPGATGGSVSIRMNNLSSQASSTRGDGQDSLTNLAASLPQNVDRIDVRVGLAKGPWREDLSTPVVTSATGPAVSTTQPAAPIVYGKITQEDGRCVIEMLRNNLRLGDRQRRIMVVLNDGREVGTDSSEGFPDGRTIYRFPCAPEKVARIVWRSRPYEWMTMNGVALKPGQDPATAPAQ
jgi:hypothetical protein